MTKLYFITLVAGISTLFVFSGCGKKKGNDKITLKAHTCKKMGYTISIPDKAKELACSEMMCTHSQVLSDGMNEYNINVIKSAGVKSMKDAIRMSTMIGQKKIDEKKDDGGNFLLVKAAQGSIQEVHYYAKGKAGYLRAKCSGPKSGLALLKQMCTSLKVK